MLRGLERCGICQRKMQGATIRAGAYYRCTARTMAPGSALLRDHPNTVNLREEPVVEALNGWIGQLFNRKTSTRRWRRCSIRKQGQRIGREVAKRRLLDAESRIRRFQDAIAAGVDPAALVDPLYRAQAECAAAQPEMYWPYTKWVGTAFARLPIAAELSPTLHRAIAATNFPAREAALIEAGEIVARAHNAAGLTAPVDPTARPFHNRPFQVLGAGRFATACRAAISDPWLRDLPLVGSVDQLADSTDLLTDIDISRRLRAVYPEPPI